MTVGHPQTSVSGEVDLARIERAVREMIEAIGEDPDREGLVETPERVARMYAELFEGLRVDPRDHLKVGFDEGMEKALDWYRGHTAGKIA